jgi:hypothetical protein
MSATIRAAMILAVGVVAWRATVAVGTGARVGPPTAPVLAATAPAGPDDDRTIITVPLTTTAPVALRLPFDAAEGWRYTGGAHPAWRAPHTAPVAVDFAPPSNFVDGMAGRTHVCQPAPEWALSPLAGTVTRSDDARLWIVGDDGHTEVLVLHMSDQPAVGTHLAAGDRIGHPACQGSNLSSNGAHIHLAVMVDGAWVLPVLDGWTFEAGRAPYHGLAYGPDGRTLCPAALGEACADSRMGGMQ